MYIEFLLARAAGHTSITSLSCLPKLYTSHVFTPLQKYKYNCNHAVVESCILPNKNGENGAVSWGVRKVQFTAHSNLHCDAKISRLLCFNS